MKRTILYLLAALLFANCTNKTQKQIVEEEIRQNIRDVGRYCLLPDVLGNRLIAFTRGEHPDTIRGDNGNWYISPVGFVDTLGNIVVPDKYDLELGGYYSFEKNDGYIPVILNGVSGRIDSVGNFESKVYSYFDGEGASVCKKGKWGILDRNDSTIIPFVYDDELCEITSGVVRAKRNGQYGCIDRNNRTVIPFEYDWIMDSPKNHFFEIKKGCQWGCIDEKNRIVIPFEYDDIKESYDGNYVVEKDNKKGVIDPDRNIIIPLIYDWLDEMNEVSDNKTEYLYCAGIDGKSGCIDTKGRTVIPFVYDYISDYITTEDKLICVGQDGKFGVIDCKNRVVIPFEYEKAGGILEFRDGMLRVGKNGKKGIINKLGEIIISFNYEEVVYDGGGMFLAKKSEKWGWIDVNENTIIPFIYDDCGWNRFHEGNYALALKDGKWIFINRKGEKLF